MIIAEMVSSVNPNLHYYGIEPSLFKVEPNQLEIELLYIGNPRPEDFGGLPLIQHYKNTIQILYPWVWKYWHDWNELMLWAWCEYEEIGMTGCGGAHKTFTFSLLPFLAWLAKPTATSVVLTSTTISSLRGRIWSEMCKFYNSAVIPFGYNVVDSREKIQAIKGDDKFSIRAIAVDSGEVEKAVGKIQGVHPERMVLVVDEAAQTPPAIFTARANLRIGTSFYRFVAIANAVDQFDAHGKFCEPKNGWSTITVRDESWETRSGICLHFDGLKSPNVRRGDSFYPRLFDSKEIERNSKDFGENSLEWWSYVRGFWAPRGTRNTVLDAATIFEGKADQKAVWEGSGVKMLAALDPAFSTGGDRCILRFAKAGNFIDGTMGLEFTKIVNIQLVESAEYPLVYQIADRVIDECIQNNVRPEDFTFDATSAIGLGGILSQKWSSAIIPCQFGTSPIEGPVSLDDKREATKVYGNRVTQLWYSVFHMVNAGRVRGLDPETAKEFCTRQYELKNEKTTVESKKDMKKRTGGQSPDLADPAALICDLFIRQNGGHISVVAGGGGNQAYEWDRVVDAHKLIANYNF